MDISLLRSKIIIQKQTVTVDEVGNHINTWTEFHPCFAYVNMSQKANSEEEAAGQTVSRVEYVFTVRWCEKLRDMDSEGYRILFDGKLYNILSVDDFQYKHETIKLKAERIRR